MTAKTVDEYVAGLEGWQAEAVSALRQLVREAAPKASEAWKWGQPVYEENGPLAWIKAYKAYINFGFWRGTQLSDPKGLLQGEGDRMRHVKITSLADLNRPALKRFVKEAAKLNREQGNPTMKANR
jgi:hypothetical protein